MTPKRKLLLITLLGLILRIGYAAAIYEPSLLPFKLDDFVLYRAGAEIILRGDLSFSNDLFLIRPLLYPLFVAGLGLQPLLIMAVNILLASAIIPLSYLLSRQLRMSKWLALLASFIVALDPTSIKYSGILVAEPLANLLLTSALLSLATARGAKGVLPILFLALMAGAFIALSALARPATYLFALPMALWLAFARRRRRALAACALLIFGFGGAWLWMNHNAETHGHRTFPQSATSRCSIIARRPCFTRRAAWTLMRRRRIWRAGWNRGWAMIPKVSPPPSGMSTIPALPVAERNDRSRHRRFSRSPAAILVYDSRRTIPHADSGVGSSIVAWHRLNLGLLLGAAYGLSRIAHEKHWATAAFLALPCLYFIGGTLLVCTSCVDTRGRTMITPLLAIMAAYGIMHLLNRRRAASASLSRPADN